MEHFDRVGTRETSSSAPEGQNRAPNLLGSRSPKDLLKENAELRKIREEQCEMIRKLEEQADDVARFRDDQTGPSSACARDTNSRILGRVPTHLPAHEVAALGALVVRTLAKRGLGDVARMNK